MWETVHVRNRTCENPALLWGKPSSRGGRSSQKRGSRGEGRCLSSIVDDDHCHKCLFFSTYLTQHWQGGNSQPSHLDTYFPDTKGSTQGKQNPCMGGKKIVNIFSLKNSVTNHNAQSPKEEIKKKNMPIIPINTDEHSINLLIWWETGHCLEIL
jgi:hypothetical protein